MAGHGIRDPGSRSLASRYPQSRILPPGCRGQSFNFGPREDIDETVESLIRELKKHWPGAGQPVIEKSAVKPEAGLLRLDCTKAKKQLGWHATLDFAETAAFTADWYRRFLKGGELAWPLTTGQIREYVDLARKRNLSWAH